MPVPRQLCVRPWQPLLPGVSTWHPRMPAVPLHMAPMRLTPETHRSAQVLCCPAAETPAPDLHRAHSLSPAEQTHAQQSRRAGRQLCESLVASLM